MLETNRNLLSVSDLLMASFCTQTEDAIRAICKRALRRGNRASNRPRPSKRPVQHCSASRWGLPGCSLRCYKRPSAW